ncbi:MAG TPA: serine hydrolase domain-containing protein [Longimicrobiales bacterium]
MLARLALAAALLAGAAPSLAQTRAPDPSRIERGLRPPVRIEGRPEVTFELTDRMRLYHVPGVSIAVIDGDRVVWAKGFGVKLFGGTEPVDTSTLFLAGSISKPVFATGALDLVEQGKLGLDEDINRYLRSWHLPESRFTEQQKVTLRRILSHNAGLTVWGFPGYEVGAALPTLPQVLDGQKPANTEAVRNDTVPGSRWRYSGGGITIAQLAASDVAGEPFPRLMRRLVLGPAGMVHSTYENPPPPAYVRFAASGHEKPDTAVPGGWHVYPEMAAAGLWTTPSDLARWAIALAQAYQGRTGGPISPAMARQMLGRQVQVLPPYAGPIPTWWGLGVSLAGEGDSLRFSHGGRDEGFVASLVMWPAQHRGLVVMTNGVSGALLSEIARAFDAEYGLTTEPRALKRVVSLDSVALAGLPGVYRAVMGTDTLTITVRQAGAELWLRSSRSPDEVRLFPQGSDAFFGMGGADWTFERAAPGGPATALVRQSGAQRLVLQRLAP